MTYFISVASGSAFRTPLRCTLKDKSKRESSSRPGIMLSTPMSSSCTSPGSSLYGWSSESQSISVIQRSSNLRESLGTPCRHVSSENTASQESALQSHLHNPSSTGSLPSSISKTSKPSGLRMPSPKIGFFDMVSFMFFTFRCNGAEFSFAVEKVLIMRLVILTGKFFIANNKRMYTKPLWFTKCYV